jgi:hypothetical protein
VWWIFLLWSWVVGVRLLSEGWGLSCCYDITLGLGSKRADSGLKELWVCRPVEVRWRTRTYDYVWGKAHLSPIVNFYCTCYIFVDYLSNKNNNIDIASKQWSTIWTTFTLRSSSVKQWRTTPPFYPCIAAIDIVKVEAAPKISLWHHASQILWRGCKFLLLATISSC